MKILSLKQIQLKKKRQIRLSDLFPWKYCKFDRFANIKTKLAAIK